MGCASSKPAEQAAAPGGSAAKPSTGGGGNAAPAAGNTAAGNSDGVGTGHGINKCNFILERRDKITDYYDSENQNIGAGSYGSVSKAKRKETGALVAIKKISKVQVKNVDRFKLEIKIMKILDHPNIIKLFEHFEDHKNIYLVMELCTGNELFDRIIDESRLSERQSAIIMRQVFRALSYMHECHVMHRDLKPENFLFSTKESVETTTLKLIDFGLSRQFEPGEMMTTRAGTPYYVAPQVLAGKYDHMCDQWSAGVIMYIMLVGYPPFYADNDTEVLAKVRHGKYNFINQDWKDISADAKELIRGLLKMSTKDRFTAAQALEHP